MFRFCAPLLGSPHPEQVYDCLIINKLSPEMSDACAHEVTRRQRLINADYKYGLIDGWMDGWMQ